MSQVHKKRKVGNTVSNCSTTIEMCIQKRVEKTGAPEMAKNGDHDTKHFSGARDEMSLFE